MDSADVVCFFFFKQKTAYEIKECDWSSDVCSSDLGTAVGFAGTTGKIRGKITDDRTGDPLPGVNVLILGTTMGAATGVNGVFFILNVPPGTYKLRATMVGYTPGEVTNVKVFTDLTATVNIKLSQTVLQGKEVTIVAERPMVQRDATASAAIVTSDDIAVAPIENFKDILVTKAGVSLDAGGNLHIRGGRSGEIAYIVDGIANTNPFNNGLGVEVATNAIEEMSVITGSFNAEYGQVMSGVVEVVTKDPSQKLKMGGTFYFGDYISSDRQLYYHINDISPSSIYNAQFYATGPVPFLKNKLGYYFSLRRFYNDGWIYGQRRFNPSDSSNFQSANKPYMEETGDNRAVSMNDQNKYFGNIKLVLRISPSIKLTYNFLGSFDNYRTYNHLFRFNPDGDVTNHKSGFVNILNWNHMISSKTFYTVKFSYSSMTFKSYLYKNPDDPRYVNPELLRNREDSFSFLTGGTNMTNFVRSSDVNSIKFDITSQATKIHQIKSGFEYKYNTLYLNSRIAGYRGKIGGGLFSADAFFNSGEYENHPVVFSYYAQDKIELPSMTLNIGMRYDYFNSNGLIPVDLRDPDNSYNSRKHAFLKTKPKKQVSPRIGIAFPISVTGVIHTSYGHFFQIPPYEYLYVNPKFAVAPGGLNTLMGNADLNSQSTVIDRKSVG